jgi:hypothetical protein
MPVRLDVRPHCEGCGGGRRTIRRVPVQPVGDAPYIGTLALCPDCLGRKGRTWRLRWRAV